MRSLLLLLGLLTVLAGCKPEKPEMTEFRVTMAQALEQGEEAGLSEGLKEEPIALVGEHPVTLGELARAIKSLPPFSRYYYSSADKVEIFLKDYLLMNLCADKAVKAGLAGNPMPRQTLLRELARQVQNDFLAHSVQDGIASDQVKLSNEEMDAYRDKVWTEHLAGLRAGAEVQIDREALARVTENLKNDSKP